MATIPFNLMKRWMLTVVHILVIVLMVVVPAMASYNFACFKGTAIFAALVVSANTGEWIFRQFFSTKKYSPIFYQVWKWLQVELIRSFVALAVLATVFFVLIVDIQKNAGHIEQVVIRYFSNDSIRKKTIPPVPIDIENGEIRINPDYKSVTTGSRCNCLFYLGPAGVGKAPASRRLLQSFGESVGWQIENLSMVSIKLYDLTDKDSKWSAGTNKGLANVSSIISAEPRVGLIEWYAKQLSEQLFRQDKERKCQKIEEYEKEIISFFEERKTRGNGVLFVIDDLDEVGDRTLEKIIRMSRISLKKALSKEDHRLTVAFFGRGEITVFARTEIDRFHDLSANGNGKFNMRTHLVRPLPIERSDELQFRLKDSFYKLKNISDQDKEKTITLWKNLLFISDSNNVKEVLAEVTSYVDAANEVAKYLSSQIKEKKEFDLEAFSNYFFVTWWMRGEKHNFPPIESDKGRQFKKQLESAVRLIRKDGGTTYIGPETTVLYLTGYVDIIPLRPIPRSEKVKLQFPRLFEIIFPVE